MVVSKAGHRLELHPSKAIWWHEQNALLVADVHLGKANHFRRAGVQLPAAPNDTTLERLIALLQQYTPARMLFLGDLFHSHYNFAWDSFGQVLSAFPATAFELIRGNHDIMSDYQYDKLNMIVHTEPLTVGNFILSHEPLEGLFDGYNLAGHVHPGVRLRGKGRQSLRFPCFYFGKKQGLLPAFGELTGTYALKPQREDEIFIIAEGEIIKV